MNRDSNFYTFTFAALMVLVVASVLAFTARSLKDLQDDNIKKEKMQNILSTVGINIDREGAENLFNKYITEQLAVKSDGSIDNSVNVFKDVKLALELKKSAEDQDFPLYVAQIENDKYYIIPIRGNGLWNAIFGYISIKEDLNTVKGVVFDHVGETAGLGAEITQDWFKERFIDEKLFDSEYNLMGITVSKTNNDPSNLDKSDHEVDFISGATITCDGVTDMIKERINHYVPYFKSIKESSNSLAFSMQEISKTEIKLN
jgi:Na+-transporting NADH:ubiquinone oxidoreductase subunit C